MQIINLKDFYFYLNEVLKKYNLSTVGDDKEYFHVSNIAPGKVEILIYTISIENFRKFHFQQKYKDDDMCCWLQEIFDFEIIPYLLIGIEYQFIYLFSLSNIGRREEIINIYR